MSTFYSLVLALVLTVETSPRVFSWLQVEKGVCDKHSSVIYLGWSEYFPKEFVKYSLNDQRHKHVTPGHWRASYLKSTEKSKSERLSVTRKHLI